MKVFLLFLFLCVGCVAPQDWTEGLPKSCWKQSWQVGLQSKLVPDQTGLFIEKDCADALTAILPFDSSFENAPQGLKNRVIEAFATLLAYPLRIPEKNQLFGIAPQIGGVFPTSLMQVARASTDPNRALFNYVVNQVDVIEWREKSAEGFTAHFGVDLTETQGVRIMTVYNSYWTRDEGLDSTIFPFFRASTLVHEARHSDGYFHLGCTTVHDGADCDSDLSGPYGFQLAYLHFLLAGSGDLLHGDEITLKKIGYLIFRRSKQRINHLPKELRRFLDSHDETEIDEAWLRKYQEL